MKKLGNVIGSGSDDFCHHRFYITELYEVTRNESFLLSTRTRAMYFDVKITPFALRT